MEPVRERPAADEAKTEPKIDFRILGILYASVEQGEDGRIRVISRLMHQVKNHPIKDALIADLQKHRTYDPFSEESKKMIQDLENVK